jgi:PAS domain S-box-containing protein
VWHDQVLTWIVDRPSLWFDVCTEHSRRGESPQMEAGRMRDALLPRDHLVRVLSAWRTSGDARTALTALLVAVAYYVGAQIGFAFTFPSSPLSVIWPPNAILFAALLLVPTRQWRVLLLAVLPAHLLVESQHGLLTWTVLGLYVTNCTEALLGATGVRRFAGGPPWFDSFRRMAVYVACAAVGAPFVTSFLDSAVVVLTHWGADYYWLLWQERFLSNLLTYLTVPPVILIAATNGHAWFRATSWRLYTEAALLALGVLVAGLLVFSPMPAGAATVPALLYAPLPLLLWAAVRFGVGGTSAALLGFTLLSTTLDPRQGRGPFYTGSAATNVLALQLLLIAISAPLLFLAALLQERRRAEHALQETRTRYALATAAGGVSVWTWDRATDAVTSEDSTVRTLLGVPERAQVTGAAWLEHIHPDDRARLVAVQGEVIGGTRDSGEVEARIPDTGGAIRWHLIRFQVSEQSEPGGRRIVGTTTDITERKRAEEALQASEERYRDLVESQREMICRYLPDTTLTFVNAAFCRSYGRPREELIGRRFLDLMDEPAREHHIEYTAALLAHPHTSVDEHEVTLPDGSIGWQQWVDHAIYDAAGQVVEIQAIGRDITERKRAEEAREEARAEAERQAEQLDRVFEAMADGVAVYDAQGRVVRENAAQHRLLGLDAAPPGYVYMPLDERMALFAARDERGRLLATDEGPLPRALRGEVVTGAETMDITSHTLDGHEMDLTISAAPLRDRDGRIVGAVAIYRDQTERNRLARELAEQAEQLDRIVEGMGEGVFVYDTEGQVVRTNAAARRLLGLDAAPLDFSHLPGQDRVALYAPRDQQGHLLTPEEWLVTRALHGDVLAETEARDLQMRALDGRELEVSASVAPLHDREGQVMGAVLLLSDRTERNRLAREREEARANELALRETSRRMDEFLATASHELNSPLTTMKTTLQGLTRRLYGRPSQQMTPEAQAHVIEQAQPFLRSAERATSRLVRLVGDLLEVTRSRVGALELRLAPADLATIVREAVEEQQQVHPTRTLLWELLALTQPVPVVADADRIGQVVTNYLTNALKYSPAERPVTVRLEVAGASATVSVRDEGPGIPADEQARVWELYHRVPGVEVHEGGGVGLGLGLSISRTIMERHGGQVGVASEVGKGSTFWFTLPLADALAAGDPTAASTL